MLCVTVVALYSGFGVYGVGLGSPAIHRPQAGPTALANSIFKQFAPLAKLCFINLAFSKAFFEFIKRRAPCNPFRQASILAKTIAKQINNENDKCDQKQRSEKHDKSSITSRDRLDSLSAVVIYNIPSTSCMWDFQQMEGQDLRLKNSTALPYVDHWTIQGMPSFIGNYI